jgi:hypothetical protein
VHCHWGTISQKYILCQILLLNMISLILNIVHQKLFYIRPISGISVCFPCEGQKHSMCCLNRRTMFLRPSQAKYTNSLCTISLNYAQCISQKQSKQNQPPRAVLRRTLGPRLKQNSLDSSFGQPRPELASSFL